MRILHATDFSHTAELARALAVDIAHRASARLHVVHVLERHFEGPGRFHLPPKETLNPELRRRLEDEQQAEALRLRTQLNRLAEGGTSAELVWGEPLRELLRLAAEYDLMVMGAHGQTPFDEVFLGGIAGRLVRRTTTPVLTVRESCTTQQVRRLLVATNFKEAALAAWTFANWFASQTDVKLVLGHVADSRDGEAGTAQARLDTLSAGRAERIVIGGGNPIEALPEMALDVGADAIVVGMKRHGAVAGLIMGKRADALVRSSAVPILCVPAT